MNKKLASLCAFALGAASFAIGASPASAADEYEYKYGPECTIFADGPGVTFGTAGDDVICGDDSNNIIYALGGNDVVFAMGGNDVVFLGDGTDEADLGAGNDRAYGGNGDDFIRGGMGDDQMWGQNGDDFLVGSLPLFNGHAADSDLEVYVVSYNPEFDRAFGGNGFDFCDALVTQTCEVVFDSNATT